MDPCIPSSSTSSDIIPGACHLCSKIFKNVQLRNRHIKRIHKIDVSNKKMSYIICPLCEQDTNLKTNENLRKHLQEHHQVNIELITFEFSSKQEYETWKDIQKIETCYVMQRTVSRKEHTLLYYECNRSNLNGYKPNYKVNRTEKSGGSIRIKGVCPSRLICKLSNQGHVSLSYWKTHAGHKEELRTMHLSKAQEKMVVDKLKSGVPSNRILEDCRKMRGPVLDRLSLLTSNDISNLSKKYNIHKKRDKNDMVATALKVEEWNANNKNYAFLFKKEDNIEICLEEISIIKSWDEDEGDGIKSNQWITQMEPVTEQTNVIQERSKRNLQMENLLNLQREFMEELDDKSFTKFVRDIRATMRKAKEQFLEKKKNITNKVN